MNQHQDIVVENLDHLGLVAGIIDELGIVEQINQLVGEQPGEIVSPGHAVKAMILNGLGMVSAPLYLFPRFFEGKATEHLIGAGIEPKHLNDDRLGRVLDKLYLTGLSQIFLLISLAAAQKYQINLSTGHLDSSSMSVHGEYDYSLPQVNFIKSEINPLDPSEVITRSEPAPTPISITYGYSRDHRPDLKQFLINLICSSDGDVPIFLQVADGNQVDSAKFAKIILEFKRQLTLPMLMVADSALYTAENLESMGSIKWLSRVPLTLKQAQQLILQVPPSDLTKSEVKGYSWSAHKSQYGSIEQRWLLVESESRRKSDLERLDKQVKRAHQESSQKLRQLSEQEFACIPDARKAADNLSQKLKYHTLTEIEITQSDKSGKFKIQANLEVDNTDIKKEIKKAGRFILATNVLEESSLSNDDILKKYKEQQSAERGFRFLKDPLFFTDSVFIKSPERIEALALIMGLCLLVYTLAQRQLRQALKEAKAQIKNQLGKLTNRPTIRWIFQCFQSIHLLLVNGSKQISNLNDSRLEILNFFPNSCRWYYLLS